jgi:hypothetical protein
MRDASLVKLREMWIACLTTNQGIKGYFCLEHPLNDDQAAALNQLDSEVRYQDILRMVTVSIIADELEDLGEV